MKKARLIITLECRRNCKGCCNTYKYIMQQTKVVNINQVKDYDEVCVTGGEPMIDPIVTLDFIIRLRRLNNTKIYLYTALYDTYLDLIIPHVDGLQFSLHPDLSVLDIIGFQALQQIIMENSYSKCDNRKSFRLFIDNRIRQQIQLIPSVWNRITTKWLTENELLKLQPNGLPFGEELLILDTVKK